MKKKRLLAIVLSLALVVVLLGGISASAAAPAVDGIYGLTIVDPATSGYSNVVVNPLTATGTTKITAIAADINGDDINEVTDFYPGAVKFQLTFTGAASTNYMVYLLKGASAAVPTEANLAYLNLYSSATATVDTGTTGEGTAALYPSSIDSGETYSIWIAAASGCKKVATFMGYAAYTLGDVNLDKKIDSFDALMVLRIKGGLLLKENGDYTQNQALAADVNKDGKIDSFDALGILRLKGGLINSFDEIKVS